MKGKIAIVFWILRLFHAFISVNSFPSRSDLGFKGSLTTNDVVKLLLADNVEISNTIKNHLNYQLDRDGVRNEIPIMNVVSLYLLSYIMWRCKIVCHCLAS